MVVTATFDVFNGVTVVLVVSVVVVVTVVVAVVLTIVFSRTSESRGHYSDRVPLGSIFGPSCWLREGCGPALLGSSVVGLGAR